MSKQLGMAPLIHPTAQISDCQFGCYNEVGARTKMTETRFGDYSYVVEDADIIYAKIGKFCSLARGVRINPGNHPLDRAALHHFTYRARRFDLGDDDDTFFDWRRKFSVTLGHDVWIGHGAVVLPGITIGTGAAVGAGAVVTQDVAPFTIVVGTPAKPVHKRFDEATIAALLDLAWWDWPHDRLRAALSDFQKLSAADFAAKHADRPR
ncbi:MAG: chloramphenicol acetyltransferase [Magnetospiraceae bacterium]